MRVLKKIAILIVLPFLFTGCIKEQNQQRNRVPYIFVSRTIQLNLPEASGLQVAGGHAVFLDEGVRGIIVHRIDQTNFRAFDLACPHLFPSQCGTPMDFSQFPELTCTCGENEETFNLLLPIKAVVVRDENGVAMKDKDGEEVKEVIEVQEYSVFFDGGAIRITN